MKNPDIVFSCRKCGHLLFIPTEKMKRIISLLKKSCPECGEEGFENWIFCRSGNYDKEYGDSKK